MTSDNLFIYGSLAPGCPNHHVVSHIKGNWVEGKVRGRLVEEGWGAALGFSGIILDTEQRSEYFVEGGSYAQPVCQITGLCLMNLKALAMKELSLKHCLQLVKTLRCMFIN